MKTNRRNFIRNTALVTAGLSLAKYTDAMSLDEQSSFSFAVQPLPYAYADLEPSIDKETMQIHYERHYGTYVKNANEALTEEKVQVKNAEQLFAQIGSYSKKLRNNAGGAYNHALFWSVMRKPQANNLPTGSLLKLIEKDFGSFANFKTQYTEAATKIFGSGWAWLILSNGKLSITTTPNQDNPLMADVAVKGKPILGLDIWEHAYYLKYQNKRAAYIEGFWNIINWDQVAKNLK